MSVEILSVAAQLYEKLAFEKTCNGRMIAQDRRKWCHLIGHYHFLGTLQGLRAVLCTDPDVTWGVVGDAP